MSIKLTLWPHHLVFNPISLPAAAIRRSQSQSQCSIIMNTLQISLCFILFFVSTTSLLCSAAEKPDTALDIDGNKLKTGVDYYILPVVRGRGGGLTLSSTRNKTCPLSVMQEQFEVKNGLPLRFDSVNSEERVVHVSTDQNIKFSAASICVQSTVWKLDAYDESTGKYFVTTGGVEGNPGIKTISNWFKIEKFESDYKLVFCPTVCNYCKVICKDVGIFLQDGKRRLALTDDARLRSCLRRLKHLHQMKKKLLKKA